MSPKEIVNAFNDCINNRDVNGLEQLMTDDHTFIDSVSNVDSGKSSCLNAWRGFFQGFPDYRNHFQDIKVNKDLVLIVGRSTCSNPMLEGSAIWTAKIKNFKIDEWRVFEDTAENRQKLGLNYE